MYGLIAVLSSSANLQQKDGMLLHCKYGRTEELFVLMLIDCSHRDDHL
jgi:hypothetical protein